MKKLNLDEIKEMLGRIGPAIGESFDKVEDSWGEIKEAVTPDIEQTTIAFALRSIAIEQVA